jgi:DNA-binding NtrC family response regulator
MGRKGRRMNSAASSKKRILIVEDETSISSVCSRVLTGDGFKVEITSNCKLAQEMIAKEDYDLCLVDIRTPIVSGEELYVWLLQEHPQMTSRVILTSGDIMGEETRRFVDASRRPFLPKPFTPDELKKAVREALKKQENTDNT